MIILDTNVISEEMKASPDLSVHAWLGGQVPGNIYTTAVTEAEIRYGIALLPDGRRKRELGDAAGRVLSLFAGRILPFDSAAATVFGDILAERRQLGRPMDNLDAEIAAIARSRGMALATRDIADFEGLGLLLINPWMPQTFEGIGGTS